MNNYFEDEEEDDSSESVCAFCDNGGQLLCCEGSCMRSFHATKKDGEHSLCASLGLTKTQIERYYCPNCEHKRHQCFICNNLGSSDNSLGAAQVFQCVSATCGYFYHPRCVVTKQLPLAEAEALERQVIAGEFICPLHKCSLCGSGEDKSDFNLQFAVCQRCPKSYHRKCLPREISFEDIEEEDIIIRAWDGLLHNRILIYCQEHDIDEELRTPVRDHIKFPITEEKKAFLKEKRKILESHVGRDKMRSKFKDPTLQDTCGKASLKSFRSSFPSSKDHGVSTKKHGFVSSPPDNLRKRTEHDPSKSYKTVPQKSQKMMEPKESCKASNNEPGVKEADKAGKSKCIKTDSIASKELQSDTHTLDNNSQRRLFAITTEATKETTTDSVIKVHSTHSNSTGNVVDKTITKGKIKGLVQANGKTLKMLEDKGSIEDDTWVVCSSISKTSPPRSHESVEESVPVITRPGVKKLSRLGDGLTARYTFGGGYGIPNQFPNEMFDYGGYSKLNRVVGPQQPYSGGLDPMLAPPPRDLMDKAIPMQQRHEPQLHFDEMNYQRMSSFSPHPPLQPSGRNFYDPRGFPLQPPQSEDPGMSQIGFAAGPNYPYMSRSGGWLED